jgi:hypothetical protein
MTIDTWAIAETALSLLADNLRAMIVLHEEADDDLPGKIGDVLALSLYCPENYCAISEVALYGAFAPESPGISARCLDRTWLFWRRRRDPAHFR